MIVVDNNSSDGTADVARRMGARVVFEPHRQIARARNAGGNAARGRYLVFVDADTILTPAVLRRTLDALESGRFCGGGAYVAFDGPLPRSMRIMNRAFNLSFKLFRWGAGCYLFALREAFQAVGGFNEHYYASEEAHFSRDIRRWGGRGGLRFAVIEDSVITSARKFDWFGTRGIVKQFGGLMLDPRGIRRRDGCRMWYERPEGRGADTPGDTR